MFHVPKSSSKTFCSTKCQHEWQKSRVGVLNPKFKSELHRCEVCAKEYFVRPYKLNNGQHNFCSNACRRIWYSDNWSQSLEWKEESRKRATKILSNKKIDTDTKPQQIVNNLLDELNIKYVNEYNCTYYSIDNYLNETGLMIEVMGDFWHCNPIKYSSIEKEIHKKRIPKDKAKHTYIKNQYGIEILYIWESDIYNNSELCKKLIQTYVDNKGILKNYHSFNYNLVNHELNLNSNLIFPYFENIA